MITAKEARNISSILKDSKKDERFKEIDRKIRETIISGRKHEIHIDSLSPSQIEILEKEYGYEVYGNPYYTPIQLVDKDGESHLQENPGFRIIW